MNTLVRFVFYGGIIAFMAISCSSDDTAKSKSGDQNAVIPAVEAVQAKYGSLPLSERLSGTVRAENQVTISPEIAGKVEQVYVQDGDQVQQGGPIVKIQDDQYREQYRQAKAGLDISKARLQQAQSDEKQIQARFKRMQSLHEEDLSSEQEFENVQSQLASAQADVKLAQAQVQQARAIMQQQQNALSKTTVRAPISGTVGQRNAEIGMQVSTDTQLFTIGNLQKIKIQVVLTDNMMRYIKVGQETEIHAPLANNQDTLINASVTRISPFLNNVTRSTEAEIEVDNRKELLKPGMFVPVDINYGNSRQATLVPVSALYTNPTSGEQGVYVASSIGLEIEPADTVDGDDPKPLTEPTQVKFQPVDVIAKGRMQAGISGIKPGKWVVTLGQDLLSEGRSQARVRVINWEHILSMQKLQRQDLLKEVMNQQADSNEANPS